MATLVPRIDDDDNDDQQDRAAEILGEVKLISFTADPPAIGPFGASMLRWRVEGPAGFHVELNFTTVAKSGSRAVQPTSTATYRLSAVALGVRKLLGTVQVAVNTMACNTYQMYKPDDQIKRTLMAFINANEDVYFRIDPSTIGWGQTAERFEPIVNFSPGRIRFRLYLQKRVNNFPDPSVDIDASFSLIIRDGSLQSAAEQVSVDVSVPWWAWAIPGAIPGLAIALDGGREDARKSAHNAIQGLVELLNFLSNPGEGMQLQNVRILTDDTGAGVIELTACPNNL
ncbi:MAG: hypothetical protein K8L99_03400, partial [Anaerolineae bacterium]|nr:hypothetical protein [Anaerolineae bacterium]